MDEESGSMVGRRVGSRGRNTESGEKEEDRRGEEISKDIDEYVSHPSPFGLAGHRRVGGPKGEVSPSREGYQYIQYTEQTTGKKSASSKQRRRS